MRKVLANKLSGTFLPSPYAIDQSLYVLISETDAVETLKTILGILLSRVGAWYIRTKYSIYDVLYPWYTKKQLSEFPIPNSAVPIAKEIVIRVDAMMDLNDRFAVVNSQEKKAVIQRQINATDAEIDRLVYDLYGLTADEIALVEGKV